MSICNYTKNESTNLGNMILKLNLRMNDCEIEEELLPQAGVESEGKR